MTADEVIEALGLEPLPMEGGAFRETYRSAATVAAEALSGGYAGPRNHSTQIYYLLRPGETSALHRVRSDEVFHHYLGDAVRQLLIDERERAEEALEWRIGPNLLAGDRPQRVVPAGVWQGAVLADGGRHGFALLGCTVSPGFDWDDFELISPAAAETLAARHPGHAPLIRVLTPAPGRTRS